MRQSTHDNTTRTIRATVQAIEDKLRRGDLPEEGLADFKAAIESEPPDAAMSLRPVLDQLGLSVDLQGIAGATDSEAYLLVSVGEPLAHDALPAKVIGAVDILGRKKMGRFVAQLLKLAPASENEAHRAKAA